MRRQSPDVGHPQIPTPAGTACLAIKRIRAKSRPCRYRGALTNSFVTNDALTVVTSVARFTPFEVSPLQPTLVQPVHRPGWVYEEKVDGWRIVAYTAGGSVRLVSRKGVDLTAASLSLPRRSPRCPERPSSLTARWRCWSSVSRSRRPFICPLRTRFSSTRYSMTCCWWRVIQPARVTSSTCKGSHRSSWADRTVLQPGPCTA
jgi:hypothetical protein